MFSPDNCEVFVGSGCKQSADSVRARNGWKERPATIWKAFAHLARWVFPHEQIVDPGPLFFVVPKAHSNVSQLNCYDAKARDLITIRRSNTNYVQRALRFVVSVRHFQLRRVALNRRAAVMAILHPSHSVPLCTLRIFSPPLPVTRY